MTIYLVVPLLVIVAILQASVISHLSVWGVFADLPLLVVVSWSLLRGVREGVLWGFIGGVAVDLLSGAPFGAATLSMMLVGALAGLGKTSVFRTHIVFPVLAMFLATVVYDLVFLVIVWLSGSPNLGPALWLGSLVRIILPSALMNAVLMPLIFVMVRMLNNRFGQEEMEW